MSGFFALAPIGVVRGGRTEIFEDHWGPVEARLIPDPAVLDPGATAGLSEFSHIEVVFHFDRGDQGPARRIASARQPGLAAGRRAGRPFPGAAESPRLSRCELLRVSGLELTVRGLGAIDGTPVLDIKPYATGFQPAGPVREPSLDTRADAGLLLTSGGIPAQTRTPVRSAAVFSSCRTGPRPLCPGLVPGQPRRRHRHPPGGDRPCLGGRPSKPERGNLIWGGWLRLGELRRGGRSSPLRCVGPGSARSEGDQRVTSIERTAYPQFKRLASARVLHVLFTPAEDEAAWTRERTASPEALLALVVDLKCFQKMARFCSREEIPQAVTDHVRHCLGLGPEVEPDHGAARTVMPPTNSPASPMHSTRCSRKSTSPPPHWPPDGRSATGHGPAAVSADNFR